MSLVFVSSVAMGAHYTEHLLVPLTVQIQGFLLMDQALTLVRVLHHLIDEPIDPVFILQELVFGERLKVIVEV